MTSWQPKAFFLTLTLFYLACVVAAVGIAG